MNAVNTSGTAFLSHTKLNGRYTIRIAIGNLRTTEEHVRATWEQIREQAKRLDAECREGKMR
jgi:aromatic-L-amino-acid decarboxylase